MATCLFYQAIWERVSPSHARVVQAVRLSFNFSRVCTSREKFLGWLDQLDQTPALECHVDRGSNDGLGRDEVMCPCPPPLHGSAGPSARRPAGLRTPRHADASR